MTANENMRLMKMSDDAWNSQDWHTFRKLHTKNVAVYWPGQSKPTIGLHIHQKEAQMLFNAFPDNHIDNAPYLYFSVRQIGLVQLPILLVHVQVQWLVKMEKLFLQQIKNFILNYAQ